MLLALPGQWLGKGLYGSQVTSEKADNEQNEVRWVNKLNNRFTAL
jgi:hypothetical protein